MRKRLVLVLLFGLACAPAAHAAGPSVSVQASPQSGPAPLLVSFTASGEAAAYHWDFGDGSSGDGAVVQHTYAEAGRYTATVTGTAYGGQTTQVAVEISAYALSLKAPRTARYGHAVTFRGVLRPAEESVRVAIRRDGHYVGSTLTRRGSFRLRARAQKPGTYQASFVDTLSNTVFLRIRPILTARLSGTALVGSPLAVVARLKPAVAGPIHVTVLRGGKKFFDGSATGAARVHLQTSRPGIYTIRVGAETVAGFAHVGRSLRVSVAMPNLSYGSRGPSVRFLEQRLAELHYALERVDGYYGQDTYDAVLAFQKINWLDRTGSVDPTFWRRLQRSWTPPARYKSGNHFEVDKTRQVMFEVRGGHVARVIQVSTGATGNTPLGVFHVYSKTPGYNAKLMYYSMYFTGAFAIHGYPSVPAYPASHGCVRVPIWVAYSLYEKHGYGTTVIIY
jgi:N-acetylmuramoyl-L-alanine amidase